MLISEIIVFRVLVHWRAVIGDWALHEGIFDFGNLLRLRGSSASNTLAGMDDRRWFGLQDLFPSEIARKDHPRNETIEKARDKMEERETGCLFWSG